LDYGKTEMERKLYSKKSMNVKELLNKYRGYKPPKQDGKD
jgi:hypothetical protein